MTQEEEVLEFLKDNYPESYSAPTIAKFTKIPASNVRTYLGRLKGKVKKDGRKPFYSYLELKDQPMDIMPKCYCPIVMHTFYMYAEIEDDFLSTMLQNGGRSPPVTSITESNKATIFEKGKVDFWVNLPYVWEGKKKVRFIEHRNHHFRIEESALKLEVRETSNNGQSFNLMDLDIMISGLEMLFYPHFYQFNWVFPTWAFNKDHCEFRLEGVKAITFQDVKGTIYRWYDKNELKGIREEVHGSTPFKLEEILQILGQDWKVPLGVADLRNEVKELKKEFPKIRKEMRRLEMYTDKLIDEIHELRGQKGLMVKY